MAGILAPDVRNLTVGKGFLIFTPEGGVATHLGNCPKLVYTPKVTTLPHFSSMAGTKIQDFSVITQKGGELTADLEEQTLFNLNMFFMGSITGTTISLLAQLNQVRGRLQFTATNDVGPRWSFDFTRVMIAPSGAFNPISDAYNVMPITMQHVADDTGLFGTATLLGDVSTVPPSNIFAPFISGPLNPEQSPAFAQVGEVMNVNVGAWVGVVSYTFQWAADGVDISGATNLSYTVQVGDSGAVLTCDVTATNAAGSTTVTTAPTSAVHP